MNTNLTRHELCQAIAAIAYAISDSKAGSAIKAEYSKLQKKLTRRLNKRTRVIRSIMPATTVIEEPAPIAKPQVDNTVYCAVSFPDTKMFVLTASVDATDKKTKEMIEKKTRAFYGGDMAFVNFYNAARLDELVKNGWTVQVNSDLRH